MELWQQDVSEYSLALGGVLVFVVTNVDDLVLLATFFSDRRWRRRSVIVGQFLGISALVAVSAVGATLALTISAAWIALLGLAPLYLGLRALSERIQEQRAGGAVRGLLEKERRDAAVASMKPFSGSQAMAVAFVTVANGGDNLGVYVPLFAHYPHAIVDYAAVFAGMTALWCALGLVLVHNRWFGQRLCTALQALLPLVLIGLGLYILSGLSVLLES